MARQQMHRFFNTAVLALAVGTAGAGQELLQRERVDEIVDVFATYREPCRFALRRSTLILDLGDPLLAGPEWAQLQELLDRGPRGATRLQLEDAFDGVSTIIEAVGQRDDGVNNPATSVVRVNVVSTPDVQIEELVDQIPMMNLACRRDRFMDLKCFEAAHGEVHIHATVADSSWVIHDMEALLKPILISPGSLTWMRKYAWESLPSMDDEALVYSAALDRGDRREFRFELDSETLLPVAAAFRAYADSESFSDVAMYRQGPVGEGGAQIGLRGVIGASVHHGRVVLTRFLLDDVRFDVGPDDLVIDIPAETRLYDRRRAEHRSFMRGGFDWPADVLQHVRFDGEFVAPIIPAILRDEVSSPEAGHVHSHEQEAAATSSGPWSLRAGARGLGLLLIVAGALSLLAGSRKTEVTS